MSKKLKQLLQLVIGMGLGAAVGFVIAPMFLTMSRKMSKPELGLALLLVPLAFFFVIAVHEAGHAFFGWRNRFKLQFFVVGPLRIARDEHDRMRFYRNRDFSMAGGIVGAFPSDTRDLERRFAMFIAGGPLFSFLLAFSAVALAPAIGWGPLQFVMLMTGFCSFCIGLVTAIPMSANGYASDGKQFLRFLRGGPEAKWHAALMETIAHSQNGERPRDWPQRCMDQLATQSEGMNGHISRLMSYYWQLDRGETQTAREAIEALLPLMDDSVALPFRNGVYQEAAYFLAKQGELARAKELFSKVPEQGIGLMKWDRLRTEAAIAMAEGRMQDAESLIAEGLKLVPKSSAFTRARLEEMDVKEVASV